MNSGQNCSRRKFMAGALTTWFTSISLPASGKGKASSAAPIRSINIMNFIRAEEPREPMDMVLPVKEQMALIKQHGFAATWLLQYDALVEGPFVEFLKAEMPPNHEVGIWFEMNRKIVEDAGLRWRGNPDWEWDYHVPVAYSIGYTPDERKKLADTAMTTFRRVFGRDAKSIASWNLDAVSVVHFSDAHKIEAFANCRDQLATDGFTIWGAPIAGYYPNRQNAWSPAVERKNQIATPVFRLLGQDPVYYYDKSLPYPDTMEPVWPSGKPVIFIDRFLDMIAREPTQSFAYAQLGQENSFGWPQMRQAYPLQMEKLARVAKDTTLSVETMSQTGRRFQRAFAMTPTQAQVMLQDPFGKRDAPQRTVWYQSRFFRANLHFRGNEFYLRDLHVYNDNFPQPYLKDVAREHGIEQRMLAVLDGYHWSEDSARDGHNSGLRAMGSFSLLDADGKDTALRMEGLPRVTESGNSLQTSVPLSDGRQLQAVFHEREVVLRITGAQKHTRLVLNFQWSPERTALKSVSPDSLHYSFRNFNYEMKIANGVASATGHGAKITAAADSFHLLLAQEA